MSNRRFTPALGQALGLFALGLANGCGPTPESQPKPQWIKTASGVPMIVVPAGSFQMGSDDHEADEGPRHEVQLSSFLMDQFEVTHDLFVKAQLPNPSRWQDDSRKPVERVRWREAKLYCNERSLMEGLMPCYDEAKPGWPCDFAANGYRLPTEAEWEYACRAGTMTAYSFGDDPKKLRDYAWFADNSDDKYHKVGSKKPNPWGLFDMHGNVSEWCLDGYVAKTYSRLAEGKVTLRPLVQPTSLYPRVARGGSWQDDAELLRSAARISSNEDWKMQDPQVPQSMWYHTDAQFVGFRVIRTLKEPNAKEKARLLGLSKEELEQIKNQTR